jgi:hypothetical protein
MLNELIIGTEFSPQSSTEVSLYIRFIDRTPYLKNSNLLSLETIHY